MKVLIVDNNDSFTYNLKHYLQNYCNDITVIRHYNLKLNMIGNYDKILFSPGPGLPSEYSILHKILYKYQGSKSILGVCLGHQAIAEFYGAKLSNLKNPLHADKSKIRHLDNCYLFSNLPSTFYVGHYHSWIISPNSFPSILEKTSYNKDGIIMSFKHKKYDVIGVQFHPESIITEHGLDIIKNWLSN